MIVRPYDTILFDTECKSIFSSKQQLNAYLINYMHNTSFINQHQCSSKMNFKSERFT